MTRAESIEAAARHLLDAIGGCAHEPACGVCPRCDLERALGEPGPAVLDWQGRALDSSRAIDIAYGKHR